jgi:hypothetical protein
VPQARTDVGGPETTGCEDDRIDIPHVDEAGRQARLRQLQAGIGRRLADSENR